MVRYELVVRGSRVLTDNGIGPASVCVRAGRIVAIKPVADRPDDVDGDVLVELADDEVLIPGLVDTHVHVNEPGRTEWEGFASATKAAAAGGVTTIIDMPLNSIPSTVDLAALGVKRQAADGQCSIDVGFWGGAVPSSLGQLREMHEAGVFGFKCFLLHSGVDEFPPLTLAEVDRAMAELAELDGLLIVHAEDAQTIDEAPACQGRRYADFLRSRPHQAEDLAITGLLELAAKHDARLHILHLSSAEAVDSLAKARADGVRVTVETCPHYLTLDADQIADGQTQYKCCPPIRDAANQDRLWQALADGVIDFVVSDHSPSTPDLKLPDTGDFGAAWGGVSSLQLGLSVVWTQARKRGHGLADVLRWMATRPAEIVGVAHKGSIRVGGDADFSVFAPDDSFVVDPTSLHHRNPVTPYAGQRLDGVVRRVWLRGQPIVGPGLLPDVRPAGRFLTRGGV